jgi:hypothetical protein
MLEDFVDVSMDEKEVMHLWNSFVRKQRYVTLKYPFQFEDLLLVS